MLGDTKHTTLKDHMESVSLRDFYDTATRDINIEHPLNLFYPDAWTKAFAEGLKKVAKHTPTFGNNTILEVGVGIGINMAGLLCSPCPPAVFIGTDISKHAIVASSLLALREGWNVTLLQSNLLHDVSDDVLAKVDYIVGCIPQVPAPPKINLSDSDKLAHYYEPQGTQWDAFGLGLNAALLQQAAERAPQAFVMLNLSGRPGINRLKSLFMENGYKEPTICYSTMVEQHQETSLAAFATMEDNGQEPFEFFQDKDGKIPICASAAEKRRLAGKQVYHQIYVLLASFVV
jgi:methylase of polypeptide subunit release factors